VSKRRGFAFAISLFFTSILLACGVSTPASIQLTQEQSTTTKTETATSSPANTVALEVATEVTPVETTVSCADVDANWGNNWLIVLEVLEQLIAANQSCGEEPLLSKKYAAHFSYAVSLEHKGDLDAAITQYRAALLIDPQRKEALDELIRLDALPEPTPVTCHSTSLPRPDPAPTETPDTSLFVTTQGDQLQLSGQPFKVKGVNYYPRHTPWHRFLEEANPSEMAMELDLIKQAGFNTIRIFLRYEPLFTCQPEDAIPTILSQF
jgi:tetratricopeptide (TPR) repeat protein